MAHIIQLQEIFGNYKATVISDDLTEIFDSPNKAFDKIQEIIKAKWYVNGLFVVGQSSVVKPDGTVITIWTCGKK